MMIQKKQILTLLALFTLSHNAVAQIKFNALPDFGFGGSAADVNAKGTIVGLAIENSSLRTEPAVWTSRTSKPTLLSSLGFGGYANAISEDGKIVVGSHYFEAGAGSFPMIWKDGTAVELPTLGEGGDAIDVNDAGQVVGTVVSGKNILPALWVDGKLQVLALPDFGQPGDQIFAAANRINSTGEIAGTVRVAFGSDSLALKWKDGNVSPASLPAWVETRGIGITESGDVLVNGYFDPNGSFALGTLTKDGKASQLPGPEEGGYLWGSAISNNQIVAGFYKSYVDNIASIRAVAWQNGVIQPLELPADQQWAIPLSVTSDGTIVGVVSDGKTGRSIAGYWSLDVETISINPVTAKPGQQITINATVKKGTKALNGRRVVFQVNRKDIGQADSAGSGTAKRSYTIPANAKPGTEELMASLGGGRYALASLKVDWLDSTLSPEPITALPGTATQLKGTLIDTLTKKPMAGEVVKVQYLSRTLTGKTDNAGKFTIPVAVPITQRRGTVLKLNTRYDGNVNHRAVNGSINITVK